MLFWQMVIGALDWSLDWLDWHLLAFMWGLWDKGTPWSQDPWEEFENSPGKPKQPFNCMINSFPSYGHKDLQV